MGIVRQHCRGIDTGTARGRIGRRNKRQPRQFEAIVAQRINGKKDVIQAAKIVAAHKKNRQAQSRHEIQHIFIFVKRHVQTARAFKQKGPGGNIRPVGKNVRAQARAVQLFSFPRSGKMWRGRQCKTVQYSRRVKAAHAGNARDCPCAYRRIRLGRNGGFV